MPRVLLMPLEFDTWRRACHWSYVNQLGLEDGLKANHAQCFTLLSPWLKRAPEILAGKKFDQVWVEIVHQDLEEPFLESLKGLAPVRMAIIAESLEYHPSEIGILKDRKAKVLKRLDYFTHVLVVDEKDAVTINQLGKCKALWWPPAIPERFLSRISIEGKLQKPAFFSGAVYGKRIEFLDSASLKDYLSRKPSPDGKFYPFIFDWAHKFTRLFIKLGIPGASFFYFIYYQAVRRVKEQCFRRWLSALTDGCAVVNLPHMVKAYPGRVIEAMAAGQPVISWKIPQRPLTEKLFQEQEEILFFDTDAPDALARQIKRVQAEPGLFERLAKNAQRKIRNAHSMKRRVGQILAWIENGEAPHYA